jgi:hypothetical protein
MSAARGWRGFLALGIAAGVGGGLAGCSEVAGPITGKAIGATLEGANQPANREQLEQLLTSEPVVRAVRKLTRAVIDEAVADLDSDEREARKRQLAAGFVQEIGPALGAMLDKDVLPRVQGALAASVRSILDEALSEANRRRTGAFVGGIAREAAAAAGPPLARSISAGVSSGIERSVRAVLEREVAPALGSALEASAPAVARIARAGTAGALQGAADAMNGPFGQMFRAERDRTLALAQQVAAAERQAWIDELHKQLAESRRWFHALVVLAAVTGALLLGAGALLWRQLQENRRLRAAGG